MNSPGADGEFLFTWNIENNGDMLWDETINPPAFKNGRTTRLLRSPLISAGNPCHTAFHLGIYARIANCSGKQILNWDLICLDGSFDGYFKSQVLLERPNGKSTIIPLFDSKLPSRGLFVHESFLEQKTITFRCRFIFSNPTHQYISYLEELKKNICRLYLNGEFSDLTLCTRDKEYFVHKFFLRKRAPKLLESLGLLDENCTTVRVKVETMSTSVLETLLHYIFTGELNVLPRNSLPELYQYLEKCQFQELMNFIHLKNSATITTELKMIRKILYQKDVQCVLDDLCEKTLLYHEYVRFECARFSVEICFQKVLSTTWLDLRVECLGSLDEDILLRCLIFTGLRKKTLKCHKNFFAYSKKDKLKLGFALMRLNYNSEDLKSDLYLELNLAVSKGLDFTSVDCMSRSRPDYFSFIGMGLMRYGITKDGLNFYEEDFGDVNLRFACGRILSAHRIVLVAWSPVFAAMFNHEMKEKESSEVIITDIDYETGEMLLRFMYSGILLNYSFEKFQKLYAAADKYEVLLLFDDCRSYLASHLTLDNACDTLVLAYQHSDKNLLKTVQKYMATNGFDILRSTKWQSLFEPHTKLVSETLACISNELSQVV